MCKTAQQLFNEGKFISRELAEQRTMLYEETGTTDNIDGFEYEGMWIINPYYDDTGRFEVDPYDYYILNINPFE